MMGDAAVAPGISGLVAEYIVAIDVTRVRFPADAICERLQYNARFQIGASCTWTECIQLVLRCDVNA